MLETMPIGSHGTSRAEAGNSHDGRTKTRRALGDVSNTDATVLETSSKNHETKPLRRSRRLAQNTVTESDESGKASKRKTEEEHLKPTRKRTKPSGQHPKNPQAETKRSRVIPVHDVSQGSNDAALPLLAVNPSSSDFANPATRKAVRVVQIAGPVDGENYDMQRRCKDSNDYTIGISKYDIADKENPLQVSAYASDLFQRLFNEEHVSAPHVYMDKERQPELNSMMRSILIDWIVEVHMKFRLLPETLYLCVNIIDRYLCRVPVRRNRLQLVGVTALLIACKYEEIYPPEVRDCVYITDRAYTRQDVLDMEAEIVKTLEFRLSVPTGFPFLVRFLHVSGASTLVRHLSSYYMERMLQEHSSLQYKPSLLAATAVALALSNPDRLSIEGHDNAKFSTLLAYTGFRFDDLLEVADLFEAKVGQLGTTQGRRELIAVRRKYESHRYEAVSNSITLPKSSHLMKPSKVVS